MAATAASLQGPLELAEWKNTGRVSHENLGMESMDWLLLPRRLVRCCWCCSPVGRTGGEAPSADSEASFAKDAADAATTLSVTNSDILRAVLDVLRLLSLSLSLSPPLVLALNRGQKFSSDNFF